MKLPCFVCQWALLIAVAHYQFATQQNLKRSRKLENEMNFFLWEEIRGLHIKLKYE